MSSSVKGRVRHDYYEPKDLPYLENTSKVNYYHLAQEKAGSEKGCNLFPTSQLSFEAQMPIHISKGRTVECHTSFTPGGSGRDGGLVLNFTSTTKAFPFPRTLLCIRPPAESRWLVTNPNRDFLGWSVVAVSETFGAGSILTQLPSLRPKMTGEW